MSDVVIPYRFKGLGNTAANLAADTGIAKEREIVVEIDTGRMKVGDGSTGYPLLPYVGWGKADFTGLADGKTMVWNASGGKFVPGSAFPEAPADGKTYGRKDAAWAEVTSGGAYVGPTPPSSPSNGQKWVNSADGIEYTWYDDGNSQQWVEFGPDTPMYLMPRYPEGSSFPGSPANNDKFYRTDLNLLCYYNSTLGVWLTVTQYRIQLGGGDAIPIATTNLQSARFPVSADLQMYIEKWLSVAYVSSPNSGSAYWSATLEWNTVANVGTTIASYNTSADTVTNNVRREISVNLILSASAITIGVRHAKTGSPGSLYALNTLIYRLIVT